MSYGAIIIPTGLTEANRKEVVKILGVGTSSKLLTDPLPLGGYSGFEVGLAVESVPVDRLSYLGNKAAPQDRFTFPKITIGKGLYYNFDFYVHFIPFNESTGLAEYGGLSKWSFYQAQYLPLNAALLVHANSSNVLNQFVSQSFGADIVVGLTFNQFSFFFGGGKVASTGQFMPTFPSQNMDVETQESFHSILGGALEIRPLYLVLQLDQYEDTVFSAKVGARY